MSNEVTTRLERLLAVRYKGESWRLEFEFTIYASLEDRKDRWGWGASGSPPWSRADAVAFSMSTSKRHQILGFEIKASRGDWVTEMHSPKKAGRVVAACDGFYLVVADREIVKPGELPAGWGLLAISPHTGRLRQYQKAKIRTPRNAEFRSLIARLIGRSLDPYQNFRRCPDCEERRLA